MRQRTIKLLALAAGFAATGIGVASVQGQSNDALLKLLVTKGILTDKEASELGQESKNAFNKAFSAKTGMPDWITNYKLYGDFRGRFEENNADNAAYHTRDRYRYRLRVGLNMTMVDHFDVGFRLASGNPQFNAGGTLVGGQPITATQDFNSLESHKFIWIDAAFARWTPIKNNVWTIAGTIGKMDNPFLLSNMVWDYDVVPEGAGLQVAYNVSDHHALKGNAGIFVLDELNQGAPSGATTNASARIRASQDPYLYGAQLLLESKWSPRLETSVGVAAFDIANRDSLSAQVQPFYNSGNSRDADGFLKYNFNPIIGTASITYKMPGFALYPGEFPIKLASEYMDNPAAPSNNKAYRIGGTVGKAGRKGTWEINYRYQRLEADAWVDALVDEDNGAFYATGNPQLVGTLKANGWFGGTNVKGHQVVAIYSFTDFLNFTFIYYANDLIIKTPNQSSTAGHFMADLNWKF
jgi:hypothetical protein